MGVNGHWYVEIEKQAYWRGSQHTWVNRYIMSGAQPAAADALTVITALKTIEGQVYPMVTAGFGVGFVAGRAYPDGKGTAFASIEYNASLAIPTATGFPGKGTAYASLGFIGTLENCLLVETPLTGLSTTGKPVKLRKFFRGIGTTALESQVATPITAADLTAIAGLTAPWRTGVGSNNYVVIGASGAQASGAPVPFNYIANRQVPKGRKKKPTTASVVSRIVDIVRDNPELALLADL